MRNLSLQRYLLFIFGRCIACRSTTQVMLLGLIIMSLPAVSGAQHQGVNGISTTEDNQILVQLLPADTTKPNAFDLNGLTLIFAPDGRGGYARGVQSLEWEEDIGSAVADGAVIALESFGFDFAGQSWKAFHVSRHGLVTFGGPFTYSYMETGRFKSMHEIAAEFVDRPTISPLYKPLSRAWWGDDGRNVAQYVARWPDRVVVTWHTKEMASYVHGVPPGSPIRFQMVLNADGSIRFSYIAVAIGDGIVGLFPDDEISKGDLIGRVVDGKNPELPGHLDLLEAAVYESNTDLVILEITTRGPVPVPGDDSLYSYRLYFDTDQPFWTYADFSDEDFAWLIDVTAAGDNAYGRGVRGLLPSDASNRIALVADISEVQGISATVIADATQFDNGTYVRGNLALPPTLMELPTLNGTMVDLSQSDNGFMRQHSEVFHYRSIPDLTEITCRVIDVLGDRFDLLVFHSEFRVDSQESSTPWANYRGDTRVAGIGGELHRVAPCGEGRLKGRWESVIWMESDTVWTDDHNRIQGVHGLETGWDRGLTLFAHEFTHVGAAFASFINGNGEREPLYGNFCRCHWRWDLHQAAAFPWYTEEYGIGSIMGDGLYWHDNGDGTFMLLGSFWGAGLSWLDLYMMGLADAHEVPDMFILRNPQEVGRNRWTGNREMISINQIVAAEGPREPSIAHSQKDFNAGFVYLVEPGQTPSSDLLDLHRRYRDKVQEHWWHITGGRSRITTTLPVADEIPMESPRFVFGEQVSPNNQERFRRSTELVMRYFRDETGIVVSDFTIFVFLDVDSFIDVFIAETGIFENDPAELRRQIQERGDNWASFDYVYSDDSGSATGRAIFIYGGSLLSHKHQQINVMAHEYFHVIQHDGIPREGGTSYQSIRQNGPVWLLEGSAGYVELNAEARYGGRSIDESMLAWAIPTARTTTISLRNMETPEEGYAAGNVVYALGFLATDFLLSSTDGLEALVSFYSAIGTDTTWQEAFHDTFGLSIDAFYDEFEAYRSVAFPPVGHGQVVMGKN